MIDEQDLLKKISDTYDLNYGEVLINPREFYDIVEEMPKSNNWISIRERLPNPKDMNLITVLVTYISEYGSHLINVARWNGEEWICTGKIINVIAWQPLPEPYTRKE